MEEIKKPIFIQILSASLLPLILIFSMVLVTINNVIFKMSTDFAKETAMTYAERVSERIDDKFIKMISFLQLTAKNIADIDTTEPGSSAMTEEMVLSLIRSDKDIFSAFFVFEPGTFINDQHLIKTFIHIDGNIKQVSSSKADAVSSSKSSWYNVPLFSGETYFKGIDYYDYGNDIGSYHVGKVSMPIRKGNEIIGVIGIDILYKEIFQSIKEMETEYKNTVLLLSRDGQILFSTDRRFVGSILSDLPIENKDKILSTFKQGESLTLEKNSYFSDKDSFIYVFPIRNDKELYLYFDVPTEQLYQKANDVSQIILSTSVLGLILLTASVFLATRGIVKPIKKITQNANQIADGQLDIVFDNIDENKRPRNEIESLQIALKKMVDQLHQTHELKLMAIEAKFEQEKTEAESNAKTQFLANMSHEIRTPMNAISGMSELLLSENLTKKQQQYVQDIKISSNALLIIINDILDLSKLETGNLQLIPVNYDFSLFWKNIISMASFMAKEKNIAFDFSSQGTIPKVIFGDDVRLRQVLINILSNAIKFTKEGSIGFFVEQKEEKLIFYVKDTGSGIKKEDLPFLFEPFKQLDEHNNRYIKGTGLGLSITKSIVDLMGGEIVAESEYGKGSTFIVTIPFIEGDQSIIENEETYEETFKMPMAKILVVDDNEINLHVASALLEFFDINCDTAISGQKAIELVQINNYDIVFMDHMMPEMDGVETTAHIRNLGPEYEKLTIIALTANAISGAREFLITSGMNDFISKPIDKNQLQKILIKWLPQDKKESMETPHMRETVQEESKQSDFIKEAGKIEGLNVLLGLKNSTFQQNAYRSLLLKMSKKIPFFVKNIHTLFMAQDKGAFDTAMSEIGAMLGKIGAVALAQTAEELRKAVESQNIDFCTKNLFAFTDQLEKFDWQLQKLLVETESSTESEKEKKGNFEKNMYKLSSLLADRDHEMSSTVLNELLADAPDEKVKEILQKTKAYLDEFLYAEAKDYIEKSFNVF